MSRKTLWSFLGGIDIFVSNPAIPGAPRSSTIPRNSFRKFCKEYSSEGFT